MIDTDFLASLWHCDDLQRLEQAYQATKGSLRNYESELGLRSGAMYMALRHIVNGDIPARHFNDHRTTYAWAIKTICRAYGTSLINDTMYPCWYDIFQPFPDLYDLALGVGRLPISIPSADDFPIVSCVPNASVGEKLVAHNQIDISGLDPDVQAIGEQFRSWLKQAQQDGRGIVTFYY